MCHGGLDDRRVAIPFTRLLCAASAQPLGTLRWQQQPYCNAAGRERHLARQRREPVTPLDSLMGDPNTTCTTVGDVTECPHVRAIAQDCPGGGRRGRQSM
jgi:hypothetical protein